MAPMIASSAATERPTAPAAAARVVTNKAEDGPERHRSMLARPLTNNQDVKISDNQNTLKAGLRGPTSLLENQIPINRAVCPFHNLQRDGFHRQTIAKGRVNYEPSSIDVPPIQEVPPSKGGFASNPAQVEEEKK